ncbi:MAG TPA: hypothetical protein VME21_17080 [Steroidobacteraceae bacterium]|nr:hypothetical protein [Steroidobacteraceae bacterium]
MERARYRRVGLLAAWMLAGSAGAQALPPSQPLTPAQAVHVGLTLMSDVVAHSESLILAHSYDQLPQQRAQFERGLMTLQQGLTLISPKQRPQLDRILAKARVAASGMSEAAGQHNDPMLKLTHEQLAAAVSAAVQVFPHDLQPSPGGAP